MLPPIPVLSDYGISPVRGFLPEGFPLTRLPDPYYHRWETVASNLQALILSKRLRAVVDRLPILATSGLEHDAEWRRAYSLLSFIAHGYIWGGDSPADRLPAPIAVPLLEVSERLEVPPVATYAAVCLWNFKPLFVEEDIDKLENLATLNTFTGSLDESWFYLVSVAIEARGAATIPLMLTAIEAARHNDSETVTLSLRSFAERLDDLRALLERMTENCDPAMFYHRIRPYLAGSKNMAEAGLPHGVMYEDGSGSEQYRQYSGGSNAQSSLIQFFDIVLGVEHRPTGDKKPAFPPSSPPSSPEQRGRQARRPIDGAATAPPPRHNFIVEMRRYMPGPHARFLGDVSAVANIRAFVESRTDDPALSVAYDACLSMLSALRDSHITIVTRYIVLPSREVRARSRSRSPEAARRRMNLATATSRQHQQNVAVPSNKTSNGPRGIALDTTGGGGDGQKGIKGTGGTALMSFLKQARDETGEPAVEEWSRRLMKRRATRFEAKGSGGDFFSGQPPVETEEVPVNGLAGIWTMEDEVGGICNY